MVIKTALIIGIAVISLFALFAYFKNYAENRPKNEIELIFEKGFGEYLRKIGKNPAPGQ